MTDVTVTPGSTTSVNVSGSQPLNVTVTAPASKTAVGLGNVDNTSDANKPISTATQTALTPLQNSPFAANLRTTGQESIDRQLATTSSATVSQRLHLSFFTATRSELVTQMRVTTAGTAAGATPTLIRLAIYSVDAGENITLVAATPNDTTLLATANTLYTKALSANYTFIAGSRYALGILVVSAAAMPSIASATPGVSNLGTMFALTPRITAQLSSQSDLPASATSGSLNATSSRLYLEALP